MLFGLHIIRDQNGGGYRVGLTILVPMPKHITSSPSASPSPMDEGNRIPSPLNFGLFPGPSPIHQNNKINLRKKNYVIKKRDHNQIMFTSIIKSNKLQNKKWWFGIQTVAQSEYLRTPGIQTIIWYMDFRSDTNRFILSRLISNNYCVLECTNQKLAIIK